MTLKSLIPKSEARKIVVERRTEFTPEQIKNKTNLILERLSNTDDFIHARKIHCYISSRPGEVDTTKLIDFMDGWGKTIILPKLDKSTKYFRRIQYMGREYLKRNNEGYWEPIFGIDEDMSDIDLIIVPALAISILGQRVGYGGSYYDKLLRNTFAPKYVLAFEFQIFNSIETERHDIRIDKIITERRVINTRKNSK